MNEQTNLQEDEKGKGPVAKFKAGGITATLWNNTTQKDGRSITYTNIKLERHYKDNNDQWQSTNSLKEDDIPKAVLVLQKAYEKLKLEAQDTE